MARNLKERTENQAVLEQFQEITRTTSSTARQLLEAHKWDIDVALDKYLSEETEDSMGTIENPIEIPDSPEQQLEPAQSVSKIQSACGNDRTHLKLLSWNIDGLDPNQLKERTRYVIGLIKDRQPDVVYLQEVIDVTYEAFKRILEEYIVLKAAETQFPYFNAMMLRKNTIKPTTELQYKDFETSTMGRHLLIQPALFCSEIKLILMTSHFESTKPCAQERKKQLEELYNEMLSQDSEHFVIFGGDTNLRDKEVQDVGSRWRIDDMWEECGSEEKTKYTWDTSKNDNLDMEWKSKSRFDRIYSRNNSSISLKPFRFMLVGQERLASGCFPSDHWGIWCEFKLS